VSMEGAERNERFYKTVSVIVGLCIVVCIVLGVVACGLLENAGPVQMVDFCTPAAFFYFDVPPAAGVLGNYSTVTVSRVGSRVHVSMQGLFFYGMDAADDAYWLGISGFPVQCAIGIDMECIPPLHGRATPPPFNDTASCTPAGGGFRSFDVGSMYISTLQAFSFANPVTNTFLEGGSPAACVASLPGGQNILYHRTRLNSEWFIPGTQWVPDSWSVSFAYVTSASSAWHPPDRCKTDYRQHCTLPR
jgi:hypothetical protein